MKKDNPQSKSVTAHRKVAICDLKGKQSPGHHSKYPPFAFTEHGVLMLASVLNSERAIKINIQIIRVFEYIKQIEMARQQKLSQKKRKPVGFRLAENKK